MIVIGGDAVVDLIDRGQRLFEAYPGGSTLNCALAAGQLGSQVLYVSTLSVDSYGDLLANRLAECHVELRANARSSAHASLAVVSLNETSQPSYALYRECTADRDVPVTDIIASFPETMSIFHVGSCALIPSEDQDAWLQVVVAAKDRGALISIDPNGRPSMTKDPTAYREVSRAFFTWQISLNAVTKISSTCILNGPIVHLRPLLRPIHRNCASTLKVQRDFEHLQN